MSARFFVAAWMMFTFSAMSAAARLGTVYYVDSRNGNDNNKGTTSHQAWKSLSNVNTMQFNAGDKILLKRESVFNGTLLLKGSGEPEYPIIVSAYGFGKRPSINAGNGDFAIQVMDEEYREISDIETSGGRLAGIFIGITNNNEEINHIRVTNCYVHNVGNDSVYAWELSALTGGIIVVNGYVKDGQSQLFESPAVNDVVIDGCTVRYIQQWNCISISSGTSSKGKGNNNIIRNCIVEYSVADGIRMNGVRNSVIEYCVMYKNGAWPKSPNMNWGGLGAWFFNADNCTIQYCEAGYIDNWHNDGGAFDIDYYQTNSTIENCYGHDCHGYGVSIFGADGSRPTVNSTIRYNVLRNNARDSAYAYQGDFYIFTWGGGLLNGVNVYNNVSIWNPEVPAYSLKQDADFTGTLPNRFFGNVIYSQHPWLLYAKNDAVKIDSNIYWVKDNKQPVWMADSVEYHSLNEWQDKTGQDIHSKYLAAGFSNFPEQFQNGQFGTVHNQQKSVALPKIFPDSIRNAVCLISFVDFSADAAKQLVFIRSMIRQYTDEGLKVVLIAKNKPGTNEIKDLELDNVTVLVDRSNKYSKEYGVSRFPCTFILSPDHFIKKRWGGIALPAPLAFGIKAELFPSRTNIFQ